MMHAQHLISRPLKVGYFAILTLCGSFMVFGMSVLAQVPPPPESRTPQPLPDPSEYTVTTSPDGMTTFVQTPQGKFPESDPFVNPTNLLPTIYENVKASDGTPIPNTLSSTPEQPYNLHPDPTIETINPTSPTDDLAEIIGGWRRDSFNNDSVQVTERTEIIPLHRKRHRGNLQGHGFQSGSIGALLGGIMVKKKSRSTSRLNENLYDPQHFNFDDIQRGIDILEGNPIKDRAYSGIAMIHYDGPDKIKKVEPIKDDEDNTIGGHVTVHQVWFDSHIEADTAFLDPSEVLDVPFTITYVVDTLNRGHDDFAPTQIYFDDPNVTGTAKPLVLLDQTFFPMEDGTRTTYDIKLAPGRFYNLTYTWGWRRHPPRVVVTENALKVAMGMTLPEWEISTFGEAPRASQQAKEAAIAMIGDLSPAKRMWTGFRRLQRGGFNPNVMAEIERAFFQWQQRNQLPDGVTPDPDADLTLFYVNNMIYGQMKDYVVFDAAAILDKWKTRGTTIKIKLINGDYFPHAYIAVDFGGMRGWENTFHNTIPIGGDGPWFTFGRAYWEFNTPSPILVPPAEPGNGFRHKQYRRSKSNDALKKYKRWWEQELDPLGEHWPKSFQRARRPSTSNHDRLGEHNVVLTLNYEPSLRLRMYQFDPLHHHQAIWSFH